MKLRVRFAETDQMGVAHHSAYVVWLEAARVEWLRRRGLSYREMEEAGLSLAVSRLEVTYRAAVYFDDELTLVPRLESVRSRRVAYSYRVERDGLLVATAVTEHVPTDRSGRATTVPARWLEPMLDLLANDP
ncbi:MAG: acyl-CoA thioesterase [Deinococcales bacterium]|nr:acyl-CoA thioesterase [Deinococcales bacterium]